MQRVGIVTDSTCDLDPRTLDALGVKMVPLKVLIGDDSYLDWVEMAPDEFYLRLVSSPVLPKTSQPTPSDFLEAYRELADQGYESIVSIHLSSALSGTYASAEMAAPDAPISVHLVDTKKVSQAVALVVKAACDARDTGLDGDAVAARAREVSQSVQLLFVLDTLEYLVKGGRAGKAQGLAASLLDIKPVLRVNDDGIIEPYKKIKGRKKALAELAAHVAADAKLHGRLRLAVLHACLDDCGTELRQAIEATGADVEYDSTGLVGAVVGTYAGPRAVGVAYYPIG